MGGISNSNTVFFFFPFLVTSSLTLTNVFKFKTAMAPSDHVTDRHDHLDQGRPVPFADVVLHPLISAPFSISRSRPHHITQERERRTKHNNPRTG